jgi:2-polyprenyl-6-methoxyphenol hydroxylase-like FAD-dependent oxidoreductase
MTKDVAIIGGSAAGFFTAYLLARKGVDVRVFEAEDPLKPSPRTLIVTSYMPKMIGSLCESAVVNTIRRFELFADGRVATISLQRPDPVTFFCILSLTEKG